jgi:alanine dehydrogenase
MQIGVPRETKQDERRVALTPEAVRVLSSHGHTVAVEAGAGVGSGFDDGSYEAAGARIASRDEAFGAELVLKVKEPQADECARLGRGQILFTYLHLAADRALTDALLASGVTAVAYETVERAGRLPLLSPMSDIAGRLATQAGATHLEAHRGGRGVLLSGVGGVAPATVVVFGAGNVGGGSIEIAVGMGAEVIAFDRDLDRLDRLRDTYRGRVVALAPTDDEIDSALRRADLVIGAVLVAGAKAPKVVTRRHLEQMSAGAVLVDVAIDQGGCFETSRPTTHRDPVFVEAGVVHYCVTNMPGAVPRTATKALVNATLPCILRLAGLRGPLQDDVELRSGLNLHAGVVTNAAVAEAHGLPFVPQVAA